MSKLTPVSDASPGLSNTHRYNLLLTFPGLDEALSRADKESISIPFGVGICGHVAETKETVHIRDAYEVLFIISEDNYRAL